jgi:hypothetical protein
MKNVILAGVLLSGLLLNTGLLASRPAAASESYEKVTKLKCENCHKHTKEQFEKEKLSDYAATQDLKKSGKECLEFLKKLPGYTEIKKGDERTEAEAKKWALALARGKWMPSDPESK